MPQRNEFALIDSIAKLVEPTLCCTPNLLVGIGDDCAIYHPSPDLLQVSTTDLLIEQVHFDLLTTPLHHLGSKAISVNVSDICAMNAFPRYALVSLAIPPSYPSTMIDELYKGIAHAAQHYRVAIAGGDTSSSRSGLFISITMIGDVALDTVTRRNGAKAGELICVTGTLGGATAGLQLLMREKEIMVNHLHNNEPYNKNLMADLQKYRHALQQQLLPTARLDIVRYFREHNIIPTSMIDISDGLSAELQHLCHHSRTGALIDEHRLPLHSETRSIADELQADAITWALTGGEDYQLLFTVPKAEYNTIAKHNDITIIGEIKEADEGILLRDSYGMTIELSHVKGFDHFA